MKTVPKVFFPAIVFTLAITINLSHGTEDPPDFVEIGSLSDLYSVVTFDHLLHVDMADCSVCHHHTTGTRIIDKNCTRCHTAGGEYDAAIFNSGRPYTISCRDCHEKQRFGSAYLRKLANPNLYHIDKPGLKGAYHLSCIGCHKETEAVIGCQDCHELTEKGEKLFNAGKFKPQNKTETKKKGH